MGFFDFLRRPDFASGVETFQKTPGAVLLDVRTPEEYRERRVPRAVNLPLGRLTGAGEKIPSRETPVFVYCLSGARSRQAASMLKSMGYQHVTDLGGIMGYSGTMEE